MSALRSIIAGLVLAVLSLLLAVGGMAIALAEGEELALLPTGTASNTPSSASPDIATPVPPETATATNTPLPPTNCPPPPDWVAIRIEPGETLDLLAEEYLTTLEELSASNCLLGETLIPGTLLYVPPPTATATAATQSSEGCGPPEGWVLYTVQPQENLFRLSLAFGVSIAELQFANCMGNSTFIRAGSRIYVPDVPTRTPSPTIKPTNTKKPPASNTPPSNTSTPTATQMNSATPTPTATNSPTATATPTP